MYEYHNILCLESHILAMGVRRNFSRGGGNVEILLILFQVADDAMHADVHKTLYPFYSTSLCWLNLNSQSCV